MDEPADLLSTLLAEREEALARVAEFDRTARDLAQARGDADSDDEHDPEGSTISWDRALTAATADSARDRLAEVDRAIARVRDGWDGTCARCGARIPPARLAARPQTDRCVTCASSD